MRTELRLAAPDHGTTVKSHSILDEETGCPVCAELRGHVRHNPAYLCGDDFSEGPVLQIGDQIAVLPGVGALLPGYVLVVPTSHVWATGFLDAAGRAELRETVENLHRALEEMFGLPILMFEHGAASATTRGGGCVQHAHMHAMPLPNSVCKATMAEIARIFTPRQIESFDELGYLVSSETSYLWLRDVAGCEFVVPDKGQISSQAVRKLIASSLGRPDEWDWAVFPNIGNMRATIGAFSAVPAPRA